MNLTKSKTAKFAAGIVGFAMAVSFVAPAIASADTASDLQAQINSLLATIQSLQSQLASVSGGSSMSSGYTFNANLTVGSTGTDVMNLQKVLNSSSDTRVAASGVGSPGSESSYFGALTKAAVIKFQNKFGITPAAGYVGPITRAKLNSMGGGSSTPTTPATNPQGGALTVSGGVQPANSLAPHGASRVPFTNFTLTAGSSDVTVNSVTVERAGLAQDAVFSGVVLLNSQGLQIGIAKTLNSNHQAMVGEPWVIKAGTSSTYTVAGNMASALTNYAGQVAALNVVAINTSASVTGALPITGAQQTINQSLTVGSATINTSSFDPNNAATQPIGTTGYRFTGLRITAGSAEDLTFKSIRWNQSGSAGSSDLANVVTVVNGTSYPTTVSTDGKYFTTVFPTGIVIAKGNSVDVYVQGDVVGSGASGRIAEFDIYKNTDVYLSGNTYGYGIVAPVGSGTISSSSTHTTTINGSSNPWLQGSTLSITAGSVTLIGKANEVPAQNISSNVSNQPLGGFATNFSGESVSVQSMKMLISTSSTAGTTANSPFSAITNITIVDENGAVVAGPVDATVGDGSTTYGGQAVPSSGYAAVTFTDTVTFKTGRHVYTVKGKIPSAWANGAVVYLFMKPSTDWSNVTGQTTGNSIDVSGQSTAFSMNPATVKGASLAINISAQPAASNIVRGVQGLVLANFQLDATQSGEDVRLSSFPVTIASTPSTDLTGCQLWNGSTALNTGSNVVNTFTDATFKTYSLDNSLTVPKGTSVTLSLSCNVASGGSASTYQVTADSTAGHYAVTGLTSGNSVTPTFGSGSGAIMTVQTGSFTSSIDTSTPNYAVVAAGTSGVTLGTYKFRASNEDVNLTKVGLIMTSGTASNIGSVSLWNGSTQVGSVVFPQGTSAVATSTLNSPLKLTAGTDVVLTIKADLAAIGTNQSGVEGGLVKIDVTNAEGQGLSSGSTLPVGGVTAATNGVRVFKSYPTVALDTLSSTGLVDGKLMRFKVTASPSGPVGISQLKFTVATSTFASGGGVSTVYLRVYSDSSYSSPVSTVAGGGIFDSGAKTPGNSPATLTYSAQTNPIEVPAGSTYYFELSGSIAGSQAGATAATTLLGDSSYITTYLTSGYSVATSSVVATNFNFVWSGNATSTAAMTAVDWSNGNGLLNLPSGGIVQTRSN
jgi:hypothetical protein